MTVTSAVVVIGAPGSGKSTIGPRLAERLALPFGDADAVIEERGPTDHRHLRRGRRAGVPRPGGAA